MLLSPLLANACYTHILKRERKQKSEKESAGFQTPFILIFKCITMILSPQMNLWYQCTLRSFVGVSESNVLTSKHYVLTIQ